MESALMTFSVTVLVVGIIMLLTILAILRQINSLLTEYRSLVERDYKVLAQNSFRTPD